MYSVWAAKQRLKIHLLVGGIVLVALVVYIYVNLRQPSSCFDHKRNQDEIGIDCGGTCSLLCRSQTGELNTLWVQTFEVSQGIWSALAYIENPNFNAYATDIPYRFTLYDRNGIAILKREGSTYILGEPVIPIFVGQIAVGSRTPYRATFEWLHDPVWQKLVSRYQVAFEEQQIQGDAGRPEVTVVIKNTEPTELRDIEVVAIVYDKDQNAIAVSQTYVDILQPREKRLLTFSWPHPFTATPVRVELLPRIPMQR